GAWDRGRHGRRHRPLRRAGARDRRAGKGARRDRRGQRQRSRSDRPLRGHPGARLRPGDEQDGRRPPRGAADRQRRQSLAAHAARSRRVRKDPGTCPLPRPGGADARQRAWLGDPHRGRPAYRADRSSRARRAVDGDGAPHGRGRGHRLRGGRTGTRPVRADQADQPGGRGARHRWPRQPAVAPRPSRRGRRVKARRAVVTGLGVVSPVGIGADVAWDALVAGESGIADITLFDTTDYDVHVAGEVKGFDVGQYMDAKDARRHDRNTHLAVAASGEALRDAGLLNGEGLDASQADRDRFGMVIGTGIGGIGLISDGIKTLMERGIDRVSPFLLPNMIPDAASGMVAIQYGLRGPNMAVVSACATGGHAIGEAMEAIVRGQADLMLGAGTEAVVVPIALAGFSQMKALGTPIDPDSGEYNPAIASRPFDATRNGFVVSEGCTVLVLEEAEHAKARGARPIAEVIGYGSR